ncbi:DUF2254 domain-containing protein [Sphingomonas sp. 10B4]|uniref:DUF2254 domain-containing protein n=1 Tax=Sphingomonas sp. 10B4 TaxID=3048575 RepID=UPI002AB3B99D|nr:DUF2254 domain-containing protein [Sphingomonas sp. 10B4]MDY7524610.1 DUF2254 domain-containing protein [Sphingomonas sp. 10B4]MEB0282433.1 DUF2254 domain-containing protein [Sphingomonas sp. 10B4]
MKSWFLRVGDKLSASYWFVPTIMAFAAVVLAMAMIALDGYAGSAWMQHVSWLYAAHPNGARQMLSSIGGSMITVAGTVFSVTIAAVVYASGQYGPRLLTNFMRDRGNQVTLGTFIATFLYCLVVLRTIRSANESGGYSFVPNIALLVAVALAICSIAVLIFFIHHVPSKIHINSVIEDIGERLILEIGHRFPRFIGTPLAHGAGAARIPATFRKDASSEDANRRMLIAAKRTGYIELIDGDTLIDQARKHDLVLRLQYQPGDFTHVGRTLVEAWPPERCDDEAAHVIRDAFSVSSRRSALQDLRFMIDELVEIAARALSPGVNDPFTAVTCMDWLGAALSDMAGRELPSHLRVDDDGMLRVIAHPETFDGFMDRSFGALAQYSAADMVAALRFIRALGEVSLDCDDPDRLALIAGYADKLEILAENALGGFNLERIKQRAEELRHALREPDYKRRLRDSAAWLGGTA